MMLFLLVVLYKADRVLKQRIELRVSNRGKRLCRVSEGQWVDVQEETMQKCVVLSIEQSPAQG